MATFAAVAATSSALLGLLEAAARGHAEFGTAEFPLLRSDDLQKSPPDRLAVSLYLCPDDLVHAIRKALDRD